MSNGKSTPGPWSIETPCGFPYTGIYVVSHKANHDKHFHSFIAEIRQYREEGEARANARLIAAAPKLLEALKEFVRFTELPHWVNRGDYIRYQVKAISAAGKAIAEAEGEENAHNA